MIPMTRHGHTIRALLLCCLVAACDAPPPTRTRVVHEPTSAEAARLLLRRDSLRYLRAQEKQARKNDIARREGALVMHGFLVAQSGSQYCVSRFCGFASREEALSFGEGMVREPLHETPDTTPSPK